MDKQEFLAFVAQNFNVGGAAMRLISNILNYAQQNVATNERQAFLADMLDGTIGLTDKEINQILL